MVRKRSGWFGDSTRHYLAAKGIRTSTKGASKSVRAYFVRDADKGPQGQPESIAKARAKGFSNEELINNPGIRAEFENRSGEPPGTILEFIRTRSRRRPRERLPEDTSFSEERVPDDIAPVLSSPEPLPDTSVSRPLGDARVDMVGGSSSQTEEVPVMSPGVPPAPPGPDSAFFKRKAVKEVNNQ